MTSDGSVSVSDPAERRLDRRVAQLFIGGSALFAAGSLPAFVVRLDARAVGATFVIGSILFTLAAYGQYFQTINRRSQPGPTRRVYASVADRDTDWWGASVQLVGTVLFNISTTAAMIRSLDTYEEINRLVWGPDLFGSIAFLIASHLGWRTVCGSNWCVRRESNDWRMAALNYVGSIFFMASAIAAVTLPTTGEELNVAVVNAATFAGAVCFLAGAVLLLRTTRSADGSPDSATGRLGRPRSSGAP